MMVTSLQYSLMSAGVSYDRNATRKPQGRSLFGEIQGVDFVAHSSEVTLRSINTGVCIVQAADITQW